MEVQKFQKMIPDDPLHDDFLVAQFVVSSTIAMPAALSKHVMLVGLSMPADTTCLNLHVGSKIM